MIWSRSQDVLWRAAPDYLALATVDGRTTEVHGPGYAVWNLLDRPIQQERLIELVAERYGVQRDLVATDVVALLTDLKAGGYVERWD